MPRTPRLIINGEAGVYHVMSRTALDGFPLGDREKDFMVDLIRQYSRLYLVEILGFCVMGNHFHILVRMFPEHKFTDEDIKQRYVAFYGDDRPFADGWIPSLREKLSNISEFVREIKVGFTRYYNKMHNRRGYFWGDRFKSVIVENGETLINCLAYIDLNPLRACLADRPEDYRWNSLGYHIQTGNKGDFLSLDFGLKEFGIKTADERLRYYRQFVYEKGCISEGKGQRLKEKIDRFRYRTRYFTDSGIIGSKSFVSRLYADFKDHFSSKHEKKPKPIGGLGGIYSLKRLYGGG